MRIAGWLLIVIGALCALAALGLDTSIPSAAGRTLNLGLLNAQLLWAIFATGAICAGCVLIVGANIVQAINPGELVPAGADSAAAAPAPTTAEMTSQERARRHPFGTWR